jgi:hypothetical protein|tara:strand:- start:332 stop:1015 length:684 start_codon:yes stop_codon:yes gene_type:complete
MRSLGANQQPKSIRHLQNNAARIDQRILLSEKEGQLDCQSNDRSHRLTSPNQDINLSPIQFFAQVFRMKTIVKVLIAYAWLSACTAPEGRIQTLTSDISQFRSDPRVIAFLAQEAARAGVRSVKSYPNSAYTNGRAPAFGQAETGGKILIDGKSAAGRSIVNITHEIAHIASLGGACGGHNMGWLTAYRGIAARFEEQFPNAKWSGTTPTARVNRNIDRFNIGARCR